MTKQDPLPYAEQGRLVLIVNDRTTDSASTTVLWRAEGQDVAYDQSAVCFLQNKNCRKVFFQGVDQTRS